MRKVVNRIVLLAAVVFTGCNTHKNLSPANYVAYMQDPSHQMRQEIHAGNTVYVIQFATPQYIVCRELLENARHVDVGEIKKRLGDLNGSVFFLINISQLKESSVLETMQKNNSAEAMNMYYASGASNDISLASDSATLNPSVYHFENNYGLSPYNTIIIGFNTPLSQTNVKLLFNDRYNDNPLIQASYSKETIANLPTLEIN